MKEHAIVEGLLYRLIKKHIAGTTMSSAIEKAKELNGRKLPVSISFLSDGSSDRAKARYATTTYLELIRRIARMGLKASIQVPLKQVGFEISDEVAARNVKEILTTANEYGVFVWLELQDLDGEIPAFLQEARGVGYAVNIKDARSYLQSNAHIKALKVLCTQKKSETKDGYARMRSGLRLASKRARNTVLQSVPESMVGELLNSSNSKKSIIFEFQLGYSNKKMNRIMKRGAKASIYLPFGKDWTQYAANTAPERYARFLASRILKEE